MTCIFVTTWTSWKFSDSGSELPHLFCGDSCSEQGVPDVVCLFACLFVYVYIYILLKIERDEEECSNTRCELYINEIETKISLHRVSCEDHNHQGLTNCHRVEQTYMGLKGSARRVRDIMENH